MYCQSCGKKVENDAKFCSHCGASISVLKDTPDQLQASQEVAMNMNPGSSKAVLVCAFGLLTAFFMPWVQLGGFGMSGYHLGRLGSYGNYAWVIPILAGATILLSFTGVNNRGIGAITGIVPLVAIFYGLVRLGGEGGGNATEGVLDMAGQVLSIGAWLTIIFSIAIIIAAKTANKKVASSTGINIDTNFGNPPIQQHPTTQIINQQPQYIPPIQQPQTIQTPSPSFREQIAPVIKSIREFVSKITEQIHPLIKSIGEFSSKNKMLLIAAVMVLVASLTVYRLFFKPNMSRESQPVDLVFKYFPNDSGGKVTYDNAPVPFGNTESEQTKTPPGITHSEAKNVDELPSDIKIVTLISPTFTLGDLPHLTFKDVATNERQEYECDWSLPAIKEIVTICENQDDCPALKGQAYNVTLELKLMDVVDFDPEYGGIRSTGKKEKRWVIVAAEKKTSTPQKITPAENKRPFRDKPATLSDEKVKAMLAKYGFYDSKWNKNGKGATHRYKLETIASGKVVHDEAAGLTWQQSGSDDYMTYADAEKYIDDLNAREFAGYSDWRLPMLEDAMSLMEREKMNGNLYINPIFDSKQGSIWTVDKSSAGVAWGVYFGYGGCVDVDVSNYVFVRAVRSGQS